MSEPQRAAADGVTPATNAETLLAVSPHERPTGVHSISDNPGRIQPDTTTNSITDRLKLVGFVRYTIDGELGRGGMGLVVRAVDQVTRRELAIKRLLGGTSPTAFARFLEEAQVTAQLDHPSIIPVHDVGLDRDSRPYFSMKLVRGQTLSERLADAVREVRGRKTSAEQAWPLHQRLETFKKVCEAVSFAHSRGVIHRDLKPDNVMVGHFGEVLVMDWGLARILGAPEAGGGDGDVDTVFSDRAQGDTTARTRAGTILGTPTYMSPEQARGEVDTLDERSDLYSLGAILYELLALAPPYAGSSAVATIEAVRLGERPEPGEVLQSRYGDHAGAVPHDLEAVVRKAMALEVHTRYATVADLIAEIDAFLAGRTLAAASYSTAHLLRRWVNRHRPLVITTTAAALLLLVVSLAFTISLVGKNEALVSERDRADELAATARAEAAKAIANEQEADRQANEADRQRGIAEDSARIAEDRRRAIAASLDHAIALRVDAEPNELYRLAWLASTPGAATYAREVVARPPGYRYAGSLAIDGAATIDELVTSPNGVHMVATDSRTLYLLDAYTLRERWRHTVPTGCELRRTPAFSADSHHAAVAVVRDGVQLDHVLLVETVTPTALAVHITGGAFPEVGHVESSAAVGLNADASRIVFGDDVACRLVDRSGATLAYERLPGPAWRVFVDPQDRWLCVQCADLQRFDVVVTWLSLADCTSMAGPVNDVQRMAGCQRDGSIVIAGLREHELRRASFVGGNLQLQTLYRADGRFPAVSMAGGLLPDRLAVTRDGGREVGYWDLRRGGYHPLGSVDATRVTANPRTGAIDAATRDGRIHRWARIVVKPLMVVADVNDDAPAAMAVELDARHVVLLCTLQSAPSETCMLRFDLVERAYEVLWTSDQPIARYSAPVVHDGHAIVSSPTSIVAVPLHGGEPIVHAVDAGSTMTVDPRGRYVACATADGALLVYPLPALLHPTGHDRIEPLYRAELRARWLAVTPDGETILCVLREPNTQGAILEQVDTTSWTRTPLDTDIADVRFATYAPDGEHLALASSDTLALLRAADGRTVWQTTIDDEPASPPQFSPDGRLVLQAQSVGGVTDAVVFDLAGRHLVTARMLSAPVFTADGQGLAEVFYGVGLSLVGGVVPRDGGELARLTGIEIDRSDRLTHRAATYDYDPEQTLTAWPLLEPDVAAAAFWPVFWKTVRDYERAKARDASTVEISELLRPLKAWLAAHPGAAHEGYARRALDAIQHGADDPVEAAFDVTLPPSQD